MTEKFRFLFAPNNGGIGHANPAIGIGQQLLKRGHEVHFALPLAWDGKLEAMGFKEHCVGIEPEDDSTGLWLTRAESLRAVLSLSPFEKLEHLAFHCQANAVQDVKDRDAGYRKIIENVKPHVIVEDYAVQNPALVNNGIPSVFACSVNTMTIAVDNVPPAHYGYSIENGDRALWKEHAEKETQILKPVFEDFASWLVQNGGPKLDYKLIPFWREFSPYANLYHCPEPLSYTAIRPDPPNWYRTDTFMRTEKKPFELPHTLEGLPGKWVYFSMGTVGCYELKLMKRLLGILAKSPNRFIVSMGPCGDQLELASNMWGEPHLPQTNVIPLVDLVITHAGHNTVSECFYFGKKMVSLPLFWEQLDDARRIEELGLGLQFHPYKVTELELLAAIEDLLGNEKLQERLNCIAKRSQASCPPQQAADIIENVAKVAAEGSRGNVLSPN